MSLLRNTQTHFYKQLQIHLPTIFPYLSRFTPSFSSFLHNLIKRLAAVWVLLLPRQALTWAAVLGLSQANSLFQVLDCRIFFGSTFARKQRKKNVSINKYFLNKNKYFKNYCLKREIFAVISRFFPNDCLIKSRL